MNADALFFQPQRQIDCACSVSLQLKKLKSEAVKSASSESPLLSLDRAKRLETFDFFCGVKGLVHEKKLLDQTALKSLCRPKIWTRTVSRRPKPESCMSMTLRPQSSTKRALLGIAGSECDDHKLTTAPSA